ncbi:MAG: SusC/RagA family TonB-linked outer membrane protein, partial [Bacteroidales bacterium]|nr:SusC/RagA family TonB-linked outer membrane protein [Bacteroidales bacterium]
MKAKFFTTILVCILSVISAAGLHAQSAAVSGTVTDDKGQPVVGATVLVEGTLNGTQTDLDGKWTLQVSDPQTAVIQFSCIGYETISESLGNRTSLNIVMAENFESLDEVVLVGYGTQKKVNLTGSVSSVNFSDISENRTIITTSAALAGLAPGMMVQQTTAQPGSESTSIRIRGTGSFTSSASSPLVLVDGIEWSMDDVNPSDIESISILKDASSTAIYGTRAANGVILITTKNGQEGKFRINYSYNGVFQTPYNNLDWVSDFADYMEYMNEAYENSNQAHPFSQSSIDLWREKKLDPNGLNEYGMPNYMAYPNTDWFSEIFNNGYSQEHNLSVSGGSKHVRYMISASYLDNTGVMTRYGLNSGAKKGTVRANLEADVTKWFTLGTKLYGQLVSTGTASISNVFNYLPQTSPGIWPGEPNKWGIPASTEDSPNSNNLFSQGSGTGGTKLTWRLNGTVYAKVRPYKGVTIEGSFNYTPRFGENHTYGVENGRWDYVTNTQYSTSNLSTSSVTDYTWRSYSVNTDVLARYEATFNSEHSLGVLLGYSTTKYDTWSYQVQKRGATDWSLNDGSTYSDLYGSSYSPHSGYGLRSYFARVNYGYKDRYLFEANVRVDGSSVFGTNNRYGVFPSFSAGWRISEEPWMKSASNWLDQLKLRASWGETGNNQGIGNYTWQA